MTSKGDEIGDFLQWIATFPVVFHPKVERLVHMMVHDGGFNPPSWLHLQHFFWTRFFQVEAAPCIPGFRAVGWAGCRVLSSSWG